MSSIVREVTSGRYHSARKQDDGDTLLTVFTLMTPNAARIG